MAASVAGRIPFSELTVLLSLRGAVELLTEVYFIRS